ncbi:MAG: hypothetical protein JOY78_11080 [Pseudonocardia sp.]|nr:hypothetical protein [Pseudonocardia sp.]
MTLIAAAGLAIDAYVHFDLASTYAPIKSSVLNQGELFRGEATVATIAAAAVLLRPRRYTAAFAFVVAAAGTAAVLVYAYVHIGAFGPFPDMYDPIWYPEKTLSVWAEGIGALAALALFAVLHAEARHLDPAAAHAGGPWRRLAVLRRST